MIDLLREGGMDVKGRMPFSSNGTFLVELCLGGETTHGVYKPIRGERPLWDFPPGLCRRETAAWHLSEALGWGLVPPTVMRDDGPFGEGSVQLFVPADFQEHYFTLYESEQHHDALMAICAFDIVANSTDRKSGHCLLGEDGRIYAIDNGLTFHHEFKLRTVIWEYATDPVPGALLDDVARLLDDGLPDALCELLDPFEREAVLARGRALVKARRFPEDPTGRRYPWPLV